MIDTQKELRAFAYGTIAGIVIVFGTLFAVSRIADIRWQPVKASITHKE